MKASAGTSTPVERTRVALEKPTRVLLVVSRDPAERRTLTRVALAAGVGIADTIATDDTRSFVEIAQAIRDASPDAVVVRGGARDAPELAVVMEALRLACASRRPPPVVLAFADPRVVSALTAVSRPFDFASFSEFAATVQALRRLRRADATSREEMIEDGARALAKARAGGALAVDVSESSTSLVMARANGAIDAAHFAALGLGTGDQLVARAGLDRVRRWLPWPLDAPALLERVFSRVGYPLPLLASNEAIQLEMALAREAIAHALADAETAGFDVAAMRRARSILVTGRAASFRRRTDSLTVLVDGLEPNGVSTVFREPDDGGAERLALVVAFEPKRRVKIRFTHAEGRSEYRVDPGALLLVPLNGPVAVSGRGAVRGHGEAGIAGVLIDARPRPLTLPERDAERLPLVGTWNAALRPTPRGAT